MWKAVFFQKLDQSYKWRQEHRDLCIGDVVLLKDETAASSSYRIARITCIFKSNLDSKVHRIIVTYKNPGESTFRVSERPVQNVVLVVPVEDQDGERPDAAGLLQEDQRPGVEVARPLPDEDVTGTRAERAHPSSGQG